MQVTDVVDEPSLLFFIANHPVIDNHAHLLLREECESNHPLELIISEASGEALKDAPKTLAGMRAVKMLAEKLGCEPTWESVKEARQTRDRLQWQKECLQGTQAVLYDTGFGTTETTEPEDHDQFTREKARTMARIETLAEQILRGGLVRDYANFDTLFHQRTEALLGSVSAFKSIICYRTGLNVAPFWDGEATDFYEEVDAAIKDWVSEPLEFLQDKKLNNPLLNASIVRSVCGMLDLRPDTGKPIQFHTGLGDADMDLKESNPT